VLACNILTPKTQDELDQYYNLRWRILRKPWDQPEGSEKDEIEDHCIHIIAIDNDNVVGIGRLQFNSDSEAQIRYMAVEPDYEKQGIGKSIVDALEGHAIKNNRTTIILDAREPAVGFYENLGYIKKEKTYLLFDSIQHYLMRKTFLRE
jgi:ribosomal protein S18 acetylase RimI-like enzyme